MPHGTLANLATSAFVRTPPAMAEHIVHSLLAFPHDKATTVLDPTAGEGDLLLPCLALPSTRLYGVEISAERAQIARARLPGAEIVTCAFEGTSLPKASMSLVLANPPYFFQDGKRAEYRILADAGTLLLPGGVMVAILPARSAWDGTMINHWCRWYDHVRVWKFPDRGAPEEEGAFEDYTQICVVGVRRAEPRDPIPAEQRRLSGYRYHAAPAASIPGSSQRVRAGWEQGTPPPELPTVPLPDPYSVPESLSRPHIVVRHADEATLLTALEHSGAHLTPAWQAATTWEEEGLRQPPLMPLSGEAHVAAEVLTGLLDGEIVWGPTNDAHAVPHLFTAFVGHEWVSMKVDDEEQQKLRERGVVSVQMRQWQDKPMLGILNLHSGEVRYEQGDAVFTFLEPWLGQLAARVIERRTPLYRLDPADWEMRVVSQFGQDKQLPHAALPGLSLAQQHRVYAMGRALDLTGRAAIQGEPGTGKTRLATATAALLAYRWRNRTTPFFRSAAQPAWVYGLRRAWLKNPRTLAMLGLEPVRDEACGRVLAYRRADGRVLPPEEAGPQALPVLVSTPKKVTKEYGNEIRAAWAEVGADVVMIDKHTDIPRWLTQCATSAAPAVIGIVSHSLTRAFGREWQPAMREKQVTRDERIMEPEDDLLPRLEAVYERNILRGYRWKANGAWYTRPVTTSRFFCPECGGQIQATPGSVHEVEKKPKDEEEDPFAALHKGRHVTEAEEDDSVEPVTSRTWFTLKQRWCACRADARKRPGPRNPAGRRRVRTPLWTQTRLAAAQRKHPQLSFASWSEAVSRVQRQARSMMTPAAHDEGACFRIAWQAAFLQIGGKRQSKSANTQGPVSLTLATIPPLPGKAPVHGRSAAQRLAERKRALADQLTQRANEQYITSSPIPDSFSPYDYLYRFYRGCVALAIIDESHNGRSKDTDIGYAHHQAMLASQTRMLATGTHFGGDILGFYHYWLRFHPAFWRRLGLGWNDEEKALERYGVIQEWTKEYESDARRGSGQTNVQVSTIPAPGLSAKLIPYLLEDLAYLTVLDVGAHMPPRIEIPEIVSMRDASIEEPLSEAEQARRVAERALHDWKKQGQYRESVERNEEEQALHSALDAARAREVEIKAWADARHLSAHYGRLVRELEDLSQKRNTAARLAKGTVPRWFAALPCDTPFTVCQTHRDVWGDTRERTLLVSTQQLACEHLYPLEKRLVALVTKEWAEGRRVMVYVEQNDLRSMPRRLEWVLRDFRPWTLPNSVPAEDRQQAILQAVQQGHTVVIVPYRRVNEGLNLQSAIDTIVWFELALNLFMLDQASRRAWRLGKREEVRIYYLTYANTAGHTKLRKLGSQSGAAAAFAGEPARGALVKEAGADKTTLARLSSLLETESEAEVLEDSVDLALSNDTNIAQEEASLKAAFAQRAQALQAALQMGRQWLGGISDTLEQRLLARTSDPAFNAPIWTERPTPRPFALAVGRVKRERLQRSGEHGEQTIPTPIVNDVHPSVEALTVAPVVTVPERPYPVVAPALIPEPMAAPASAAVIGSRAEVIFGHSEHIALVRRCRPRSRSGEPLRRRVPVVEREIPSLIDDAMLTERDNQPVAHIALPSLWDLLAEPEHAESTPPPVLLSSLRPSLPQQAALW